MSAPDPVQPPTTVQIRVNETEVHLSVGPDGRRSLLDALREDLGILSAKDGCAPQGQCGCCTVLVDGTARVACVTPLRRVAGREVQTLEGLDPAVRDQWTDALLAEGGSQCGFCTPGILLRLEDHRRRLAAGTGTVEAGTVRADAVKALSAHLCRCTGWQGIVEAAVRVNTAGSPAAAPPAAPTDPSTDAPSAAARRATLEGGTPQVVGPASVLGTAGFAADTAPRDALVAVPDGDGGWVLGESLSEARRRSAKVQGRRGTVEARPPLGVPEGDWAVSLATSWVEPAPLEVDASWCEPGGEPASVLANGGAFGAKLASPLPEVARRLAGEQGRPVLAVWSREDAVRNGAKRPPLAGGVDGSGRGVIDVATTPGIREAIATAAPLIEVREVDLDGPPTSAALRAAGWAEAFCLLVGAGATSSPLGGRDGAGVRVARPGGGWARVEVAPDGSLDVQVGAGDPLDEAVVRSYVTGACHMAAGMVLSEGLAVVDGEVLDLTVRSFGILRAADTPAVRVAIDPEGSRGEPLAVSDAVFAATLAALWLHHGTPAAWPITYSPPAT